MAENSAADVAAIQKLILRAASATAAGVPLTLLPGESADSVNALLVGALGIISRASRLDDVVRAVRPIATRLANTTIEGEDADQFRTDVQLLLASLAALEAFDHREADHTIVD
jgi:hypothetical protein